MTENRSTKAQLMEMFRRLLDHFGPQHWWPGETPLEVVVGAVLAQNTNWQNVARAVQQLKEQGWLAVDRLHDLPPAALAEAIRPAGYFNVKTRRLKNLIELIVTEYGGDLDRLFEVDTAELRRILLGVNGVGPETGDSILLYAADRPVFVVDAYTFRILHRHGMAEESMRYDELQAVFMDHIVPDADLYNEWHALIVATGKTYCKKRPLCRECPLEGWYSAS